jgi:hypothetical protein
MRKQFGAAVVALTLGLTTLGGTASAGQSSQNYRGRWTSVTEVCGPDVKTPAPSTGTWSLSVPRRGVMATFSFDYARLDWPADQRMSAKDMPVTVVSKRPLTVTGVFAGLGDLTMNIVVHDDIVLVSTVTGLPLADAACDTAGHMLTPVFFGTVR